MGRISDLVEELQGPANDLVLAAGRAGLVPRVTSTIRTNSEQRRLYSRFLAGQAGYPVAPPGQSAHEYGLAFDMVVSPMEALADVGYTWRQWGGGWNPTDAVHFELPGASEWAKTQGAVDTSSFSGYFGAETKGVIDFIKTNAPTALEISSIFNVPLSIATTLWSLFSK